MAEIRISDGQCAAACLWAEGAPNLEGVNEIIAVNMDSGEVDLATRVGETIRTVPHFDGSEPLADRALAAIANLANVGAESLRDLCRESDTLRQFNEAVLASEYERGVCLRFEGVELEYETLHRALESAIGAAIIEAADHARALKDKHSGAKLLLYGRLGAWKLGQALFREQYARDNRFYDLLMADNAYTWPEDVGSLAERGRELYASGKFNLAIDCPFDIYLEVLKLDDGWKAGDPTVAQPSKQRVCLAHKGDSAEVLNGAAASEPVYLAPKSVLKLLVNGASVNVTLPEAFCPLEGCLVTLRVVLSDERLLLRVARTDDEQIQFDRPLKGE